MADTFIPQDPNPAPGGDAVLANQDSFKRLEKTIKNGKKVRMNWENIWDDIFTYAFPNRAGFFSKEPGTSLTDLIFDETAIVEMPRFVSRIVDGMFPPNNRAFSLKQHPREKKDSKLNKQLQEQTEIYHEVLRNSNYYTEIHECIQDLGVGTMTMTLDPGPFQGDIIATAIPLTELYLLNGPMGSPDAWMRIRKMKILDIPRFYSAPGDRGFERGAVIGPSLERKGKEDPMKEVTVWEAVIRIRDRTSEEKYEHLVGVESEKVLVYKKSFQGKGSNKYITSRWFTDAGETYGRGVLMQALPAIKTANLTVEMVLQNGQMAIGGTYVYDDDGIFNFDNVTIEPGTFIPRAPGSQIDELQTASRFDISQLVLDEMRNNIRRALFSSAPDRPQGRTPPSATEIAEDRAETARNMGSAITRLQFEHLKPLVDRLGFILKQQGVDVLPVDMKKVMLIPESPLLRSQDQQDIADYLRYTEALQFVMGPASGGAHNPDKLVPYLAGKHRIPDQLVPSETEIKDRAANALAAAQEQGAV
jgi:hypothetical protein